MRKAHFWLAGAAMLLIWPALSQTTPPGARDTSLAVTNPAGTQDKTNAGQPVSNVNTDDKGGQTSPALVGSPRGTNLDPGADTTKPDGQPSRAENVLPQTTGTANGRAGAASADAPASADSSRPSPLQAAPSR